MNDLIDIETLMELLFPESKWKEFRSITEARFGEGPYSAADCILAVVGFSDINNAKQNIDKLFTIINSNSIVSEVDDPATMIDIYAGVLLPHGYASLITMASSISELVDRAVTVAEMLTLMRTTKMVDDDYKPIGKMVKWLKTIDISSPDGDVSRIYVLSKHLPQIASALALKIQEEG